MSIFPRVSLSRGMLTERLWPSMVGASGIGDDFWSPTRLGHFRERPSPWHQTSFCFLAMCRPKWGMNVVYNTWISVIYHYINLDDNILHFYWSWNGSFKLSVYISGLLYHFSCFCPYILQLNQKDNNNVEELPSAESCGSSNFRVYLLNVVYMAQKLASSVNGRLKKYRKLLARTCRNW